jgi:hypothetical protein
MRTIPLMIASVVLVLGCKSEKKPPATDPVTSPAGSTMAAADAMAAVTPPTTFPIATGESYYGGKVLATNLVEWKVPDGTIVQLGIVTTGKTAEGREEGVLRAFHVGTATHDVDHKYALDPAVDHWAELKVLPNNLVMFRYGEAGKGPHARNGLLLRWDAEASRVRIAKRWAGASADPEPAWLLTGMFKAAAEGEPLCMKVIAKIVRCGKDPKFRDALFRRDAAADKAAMQAHFDTHVAKWKDPAEAKAQCQKWASDEYIDTHFSDPVKLKGLAAETKIDCGFFASEIVDEGGLPVALTDPKPH